MASTTFISLSLPISLSSSNLLPTLRSSSSPPFPFSTALFSRPTLPLLNPLRQNRQKQLSISRIHAATSQQTLPSDSAALLAAEKSQEIVGSTNDDGVSTIISVLLFTAFIGLSILTIGVKSFRLNIIPLVGAFLFFSFTHPVVVCLLVSGDLHWCDGFLAEKREGEV